jgi:hypothetical protein
MSVEEEGLPVNSMNNLRESSRPVIPQEEERKSI